MSERLHLTGIAPAMAPSADARTALLARFVAAASALMEDMPCADMQPRIELWEPLAYAVEEARAVLSDGSRMPTP